MNIDIVVLSIATLLGLYMAANIGANDLANAMGTSVGSGALTLKQAVLVSIIANVLGATLAGGHVTSTISKGIIDPGLLVNDPNRLMLGMFAALISASLWVHLATYFGLPVSTTHAIVGAVVGFGIISVGAGAVSWGKIITITVSWIISPAAGAVVAGSIFYFAEKKIMSVRDPHAAAVHYTPGLIFVVVLVLILSFIFKGLKNLHLDIGFFQTLLLAAPCAALASLFGRKWVRWQVHLKCELGPNPQGYSPVDCVFAQLQILTACYIAFAHGANDVANAVGPLAGIFSVAKTKTVALQVEVSFWMLFVGGIAVGRTFCVWYARHGDYWKRHNRDYAAPWLLRTIRGRYNHLNLFPTWSAGVNHPCSGWLCSWHGAHAGHGHTRFAYSQKHRSFVDRDVAVHGTLGYAVVQTAYIFYNITLSNQRRQSHAPFTKLTIL